MTPAETRDRKVLEALRAHGPGNVTAREIASASGLRPDAVQAALFRLSRSGAIHLVQWMADYGTGNYLLRAEPS